MPSSVFFVSLPKSGTVYTWYSLQDATGLKVPEFQLMEGWHEYSAGHDFACPELYACGDYNTQLLRPENMHHFAEGYIFGAHMQASYHNLSVLARAGHNRVSVLLRDPRDALVSWVHHLASLGPSAREYHSKIYHLPIDYFERDLAGQFHFQVRAFLPTIANWVEGWLDRYANKPEGMEFLFAYFDELKCNPRGYIQRLTDFHRIENVNLDAVITPEPGKLHYRKGEHGQWREEIAQSDHALVESLLEDRIVTGFGRAAEASGERALDKARGDLARGLPHGACQKALSVIRLFPSYRPAYDIVLRSAAMAGVAVTELTAKVDTELGVSTIEGQFLYRYELVDAAAEVCDEVKRSLLANPLASRDTTSESLWLNILSICFIASRAGEAIETVRSKSLAAEAKSDGSPVTEADTAAEAIILEGLAEAFPEIPVIAEESVAAGTLPDVAGRDFFLVDPLDGTKEFIAGRPEYTVNIALVKDGVPVAGVVYAPASGDMFVSFGPGQARRGTVKPGSAPDLATFQQIQARRSGASLTAVASRSHSDGETEEFLGKLPIGKRRSIGSSLKFCLVAAGEADVYPRFGPTMEWDTAAGHAVLLAAGGSVTRPDGSPFLYGKKTEGYRNGPFVAWGRNAPKP